jgi:hypothetical protein
LSKSSLIFFSLVSLSFLGNLKGIVVPIHSNLSVSGTFSNEKALKAADYALFRVRSSETVSFFLPFRLRDARTLRPLAVAMRSRKPCLFFLFLFEGWNVRFIVLPVYLKNKGCKDDQYSGKIQYTIMLFRSRHLQSTPYRFDCRYFTLQSIVKDDGLKANACRNASRPFQPVDSLIINHIHSTLYWH